MPTSTRAQSQPSVEHVRRRVRDMWAAVADGWETNADFVESRGRELTREMLRRAAPRPGDRVLELASGAGDVGMAAAPLVDPGAVVISDVATEMTAIATRRAEARRLGNVTARTFGVEAIDAADATFDVVLCREGLMFAADPALAVREIARVLRPGGSVAVAVWGPRVENPWLGIVFDAVSAQLGRPVPPPGMPGPFALADPGELRRLFEGNGLANVSVRAVSVPLAAASFDEWWTRIAALAGPLATVLASAPESTNRELQARVQAAARPYRTPDGGLRFPGQALLVGGRRRGETR